MGPVLPVQSDPEADRDDDHGHLLLHPHRLDHRHHRTDEDVGPAERFSRLHRRLKVGRQPQHYSQLKGKAFLEDFLRTILELVS